MCGPLVLTGLPRFPLQVDDVLELERALNALGLTPLGHHHTLSNNPSHTAARYMSSTLGESFLVVNNR